MTPEVVAFFENAFNTTHLTRKIKNLQWKIGDTLEVIGSTNSYMTKARADAAIKERTSSRFSPDEM